MAVLGPAARGAALVLLALVSTPALAVFGGKAVPAANPLAAATAAILYSDETGTHLCTAVALTPRLVLTAAHCTAGSRADLRVVFATELTGVGPDRIRAVTKIARAEKTAAAKGTYAYNDPDDVALVLLDAAAPEGTAFATLADAPPPPGQLVFAGYGASSEFRKPDADGNRQLGFDRTLRGVNLALTRIDDALLTTDQSAGAGVCTGDSGGAAYLPGPDLVVAGILIGVSSPRGTNDYCRGTAWFATIARWTPWLRSAAASLGEPL